LFLSVIIFIIIFCYNKKHLNTKKEKKSRALIYLPFVWFFGILPEFFSGSSVFCFLSFWDIFFWYAQIFSSLLFLASFSFYLRFNLFRFSLDFLVLDLVSVPIGFGFLILGFYFWIKSFLLSVSDIFLWVQLCFWNLPFFLWKIKLSVFRYYSKLTLIPKSI